MLSSVIVRQQSPQWGATAFRETRASLLVTPERGKALVFYHRQLHEGLPVVRGRKYVLRTDVMYRHQGH